MSVELLPRPQAVLLSCVLLLNSVAAAHASDQPADAFDFDSAGAAAAMTPIFRDSLRRIAEHCSGIVPDSAAQWRKETVDWESRNAPWSDASAKMMSIVLQESRARGVDADAVSARLEAQIADHAAKVFEGMQQRAVAKSPVDVCATARQRVSAGLFDVSKNTHAYAASVDAMLREHLPAATEAEPVKP